MFNRAKFHPHQTSEMRDAMKIFAGWLKKYAYMSKADIMVSGVKSDFIDKLEEVDWKYYKLQYLPIGENGKYDYLSWRDIQIEKLLGKSSKKKLLEFAYSPEVHKKYGK